MVALFDWLQALEFNPDDAAHMQFIVSAANLKANVGSLVCWVLFGEFIDEFFCLQVSGIRAPPANRHPDFFKALLRNVKVKPFVPKKDFKVEVGPVLQEICI